MTESSVTPKTTPESIILRPSRGWSALKLKDLWAYRELIYFLTWRDIKVRYKQSVLGAAWAIIQPFMAMVVFTIFFGKLANLGPEGIPYSIWNYAAMVATLRDCGGLLRSDNRMYVAEDRGPVYGDDREFRFDAVADAGG